MLHLALGASEIVGEPIGRNNLKTSRKYAARKEQMMVALGSAGILSGGRVSTDKTSNVETFPKGLLESELVQIEDH